MKKSALALGVVVALGAAWTGGAWYTGKTAETEFARQIQIVNKDVNQYFTSFGLDVRFDNVYFERGLFTSKTKYEILISDLNESGKTSVLPFEGTLYHGPLPLNQLSHFNLVPTMFASVDQMTKNDTTTSWFDATKGKAPVTLTTSVNYAQSGDSKVEFVPFEATTEGGTLAVDGLDMKLGFAQEGVNKIDLVLNKLAFTKPNNVSMEFNDVEIDAEYQRIPEWEYIATGKQFVSGGVIKFNGKDSSGKDNRFELKDWKMDFDTVRKDKFLDSVGKMNINGISANGANFGELTIDTAFNHVDGETFNQLMHVYTESIKKQQSEFSETDLLATKKFFDTQPQFIFNPTLTNKAGRMAVNLDISIASSDFENSISKGKIFNLFNHFIFKIDANKDALVDGMATALQLENVDKDQSVKTATMQVDEIVKSGVQQGFLAEDGKQIKLDFILQNGQLKLNGQAIPEEQAAAALFLGAMSMGN